MIKIEGDLSIHPTPEGLFIARIEPEDGRAFYIAESGARYEITLNKVHGKVDERWLRLIPVEPPSEGGK
jgi:hypothetical protein